MPQFEHISAADAAAMRQQSGAQVVDIRDAHSFAAAHITGSQHLDNDSLPRFMAEADKQAPVIVCCYHGNSSQSAAQFLAEQGFQTVYSLDGGFEDWRLNYPNDCASQG